MSGLKVWINRLGHQQENDSGKRDPSGPFAQTFTTCLKKWTCVPIFHLFLKFWSFLHAFWRLNSLKLIFPGQFLSQAPFSFFVFIYYFWNGFLGYLIFVSGLKNSVDDLIFLCSEVPTLARLLDHPHKWLQRWYWSEEWMRDSNFSLSICMFYIICHADNT